MSGQEPDDEEPHGSSSYLVIVAVVAGVALLYWLATTFYDWDKTQACVGYGKRNCGERIELNHQ